MEANGNTRGNLADRYFDSKLHEVSSEGGEGNQVLL